jgi:predicted metalloprotease with PDZ domain
MKNGQATSDAQGAFLLQGLRAGRIELDAQCDGYRDHEVTVEVGQQGPVRIELTPAAASDSPRTNDYEGVGMQFGSDVPDAGQGYRVIALHPEGGARVAGVEIGDEILAAGGVRAAGIPTEEFLRQIKGAEGTVVTLGVRRGEQVFELHAVRRRLVWAR